MNDDLMRQAEELAKRRYAMFVFRETTTENEPIYVALNPELEGCFAQGDSSEEAQENLRAFRVDYIHHLLTHGLSVPEPTWKQRKPEEEDFLESTFQTSIKKSTDEREAEEDVSTSGHIIDFSIVT